MGLPARSVTMQHEAVAFQTAHHNEPIDDIVSWSLMSKLSNRFSLEPRK